MAKEIKITVEGAKNLSLEELETFQGKLKHINKEDYERCRKSIIDFGFSFLVHVWANKNKYYILDGHQRLFTVKQMVGVEGYKVGKIPVAFVSAKSFKEAKLKLLAAASQYGKVSPESLAAYAKENDIGLEDILSTFVFPEVSMPDLADLFGSKSETEEEDDSSDGDKSIKSGSDQVRQLQLFFTTEHYSEFLQKIEDLKADYETENVSDTLLEVVREAHSARKKGK